MRRPRTSSSASASSPSPKSPLCNVNFACYVLRHVRIEGIADVIKCAQINDAFRDALESWSPTFWRRVASRLVSQPHLDNYLSRESESLGAFFKQSAFAWAAQNLLTVGQLDASRMPDHPLGFAVVAGAVDVVRVCLAADPSCVNFRLDGETMLHTASFHGHAECVRELLAADADVTLTYYLGTALHNAAGQGKVDVVRLLIAHPDYEKIRDVRNRAGETAMDVAKTDEVKQLLSDSDNTKQKQQNKSKKTARAKAKTKK